MPNGGVRIVGLREKVRALQELGLEVQDLKEAFSAIAKKGAETAKSFVPVRTGRLSASIRGNRAKSKAVVMAGRAAVPYAGPINFGWPARNIAPAHFLGQADAVWQQTAAEDLDKEIDKQIAKKGLK